MKAIVRDRYGSPDVLQLREVEVPPLPDDGMLVRVRASSVNPVDWHLMRGQPYLLRLSEGLRRPKATSLGVDVAGVVEAVGSEVTDFAPGDEVFGARQGAFAEQVVSTKRLFARKPAGLTWEAAAAVPVAATTALQAVRDKGGLRAGEKVLVIGAGGGVGHFAVQVASALGGRVTAVTSSEHAEMVASLGPERVVDYRREDFTRMPEQFDLVVDISGTRSLGACRRLLTPDGRLVIVGGPPGRVLGPLGRALAARVTQPFVRQRMVFFLAQTTREDLAILKEWLETGKIRPVIDRTYPLAETAEAVRYQESGQAGGKVVVTV